MKPLSILFLGNFQPDLPPGVEPWSTETHVAAALVQEGHVVQYLQEGRVKAADVAAQADGCDVFLWTQTYGLAVEGGTVGERRGMLAGLEAKGIPTVSFHLDKWWDLPRQDQIAVEPFFRSNWVYTADGGNQERFAALGINHRWAPPAVHEPECQPGTHREEYGAEVAFVGSWRGYHPEWEHRDRLMRWLFDTYGPNVFQMWPRGGQGQVRGRDLADLYASAKVVIGDSCMVGGTGSYWCADEATEILTTRGWLRYDEVTADDRAYTINPETWMGEWQQIQAVSVHPAEQRTMWAMEGERHSSLTTLNHRWLVESARWRTGIRDRRFRRSDELKQPDRIPCAAPSVDLPTEAKYSDALVELTAWAWTEGGVESGRYRTISQSHRVNPAYEARIRACLTTLFGPPTLAGKRLDGPAWRETRNEERGMTTFALNAPLSRVLWAIAPDHHVQPEFVVALTAAQLRLFVETSVDADGCRKSSSKAGMGPHYSVTLAQKEPGRLDPFEMACALLGIATNRTRQGDIWMVSLKTRVNTAPLRTGQTVTAGRVQHDGIVWCPTTRNRTWLARRSGTVYFTGNSDRVPETVGRGGFLLHPNTDGLTEHFTPGEHLETWDMGDWGTLRGLIDRYRDDRAERDRIRQAGRRHVLEHHTYRVRMRQILQEVMGG